MVAVHVASVLQSAMQPGTPVRGLPATRLYTFEEIGKVTRGSQLTFDANGRVALVQDGDYVVLNDDTWINLADKAPGGIQMLATGCDCDGSTYYGALGSWGRVVGTADGKVRPESLVPDSFPAWVLATNFVDIFPTARGIFFGGWNGIVFWDRATGKNTFFGLPAVACLFAMGDAVFASSHERGVCRIDVTDGSLTPVACFGTSVVDNVAPLSAGRYLMSTTDGRLVVCANGKVTDWTGPLVGNLAGHVSALRKLVDGDIAVAVIGRGLFIADEKGGIRTALTTAEYHRVVHLANNEPGVLWVSADSGIAKVLYGSPVSLFGQSLGLPVWYPQIVRWKDGIIVASAGRLYVPAAPVPGAATRFELVEGQPDSGAWAIAAQGDHLLVGNRDGVFACDEGLSFVPVLADIDADRLAFIAPNLCLVLGTHEIAALRREAGTWRECAARVPGVGYPAVVHTSKRAAWIEIGANRAARVSFDDTGLHVRTFETFPWPDPRWIHVSIVGDTVILAGPPDKVFFDECTEQFCDAPALRDMLERAPYWVARVCADDEGDLLASHGSGLFAIVPKNDGGYVFDTTTYDVIDDQTPLLLHVPGYGMWVFTGSTLYHIAKRERFTARRGFKPVLLSLRDRRTGTELLGGGRDARLAGSARLQPEQPGFPVLCRELRIATSAHLRGSDR